MCKSQYDVQVAYQLYPMQNTLFKYLMQCRFKTKICLIL